MPTRPPNGYRLSVSIVLHHSPLALLERVLRCLQRSAESARATGCLGSLRVAVLDNSTDPTYRRDARELVGRWHQGPLFPLIYEELPDNRGFGAAHNRAIARSGSDCHLILNPDAEMADDALSVGLGALREDPGIALLSPRATGADGHQEFLCKRYPSVLVLALRAFAPDFVRQAFRRRLHHYEMRDVCGGDAPVDVPLASGCFMLVRTSALQAVGGFNDRYFLYFEDFDLSLRLAGQGRLVFDPAMKILHHGGYAAGKGLRHLRYFVRSGIRFFGEHGWRWI